MIAQLSLLASVTPASLRLLQPANDPWRAFQRRVANCAARYTDLWGTVTDRAAPPVPSPGCSDSRLGPVIPVCDKLSREAKADRDFEDIKSRLARFPRARGQRELWREELLNRARELAVSTLGLPGAGLDLFFTRSGVEATRAFVTQAKAFDSAMSDESMLQALRNLWVIHSIQVLLGREIGLSPAAFGYSMLYPWTDNYLDDPQLSPEIKVRFGKWLEQRLCGSRVAPPDRHAAQVGQLVAMIERTFPRAEFDEVYCSLRAIHQAQMASLEQQRTIEGLDGRCLLQLTVRKGGTSVLADALLVAGQLSDSEADFMFGYGVLLQLMDDLQDINDDRANGHATIFVRQAEAGCLDEVTSRLWSFLQAVLWTSSSFEAPRLQPVKALIQENCKVLLLQAVARNHQLYSPGFVAEMERGSPFRFDYLRAREKALAAEGRRAISLLRRRRQIQSAFDLLD